MEALADELLRTLGLTKNYKSYRRTITAILLAAEQVERLEAVTKEIYPQAARLCGCSWTAVERSLRSSIDRIWQTNPEHLAKIAGYPLDRRPSSGRFIEIVAVYIQSQLAEARDAAQV